MAAKCVWFCFVLIVNLGVCMQVAQFCFNDLMILLSGTLSNSVPLPIRGGKEQEIVNSYSGL